MSVVYTQYLLTIISVTKDYKMYLRVGDIQFNGMGVPNTCHMPDPGFNP